MSKWQARGWVGARSRLPSAVKVCRRFPWELTETEGTHLGPKASAQLPQPVILSTCIFHHTRPRGQPIPESISPVGSVGVGIFVYTPRIPTDLDISAVISSIVQTEAKGHIVVSALQAPTDFPTPPSSTPLFPESLPLRRGPLLTNTHNTIHFCILASRRPSSKPARAITYHYCILGSWSLTFIVTRVLNHTPSPPKPTNRNLPCPTTITAAQIPRRARSILTSKLPTITTKCSSR